MDGLLQVQVNSFLLLLRPTISLEQIQKKMGIEIKSRPVDFTDYRMKKVWSPCGSHGPNWTQDELGLLSTSEWDKVKAIFDRLEDPDVRIRILENSADSIIHAGVFPLRIKFSTEEFLHIQTMCKRLQREDDEKLV